MRVEPSCEPEFEKREGKFKKGDKGTNGRKKRSKEGRDREDRKKDGRKEWKGKKRNRWA